MNPEIIELILKLIYEFKIKSEKDIEDLFNDMLSPILQKMLECELDDHLSYERYNHRGESGFNSRNGQMVRQAS